MSYLPRTYIISSPSPLPSPLSLSLSLSLLTSKIARHISSPHTLYTLLPRPTTINTQRKCPWNLSPCSSPMSKTILHTDYNNVVYPSMHMRFENMVLYCTLSSVQLNVWSTLFALE